MSINVKISNLLFLILFCISCTSVETVKQWELEGNVEKLFDTYCNNSDEKISKAAEKAFLKQGDKAALFLDKVLKEDDDPFRIQYALLLSGELGDIRLVDPIYAVAKNARKKGKYTLLNVCEIALTNLARKSPDKSPLVYVIYAYGEKPETFNAIKAGCDVKRTAINGKTAAQIAQSKGYSRLVKLLGNN